MPTLNAGGPGGLVRTLEAIGPAAAAAGWPILVSDGGSTDGTPGTALRHGARMIRAPRGRGSQLAAGAAALLADGTAEWLFFLHADSVPDPSWADEAARFTAAAENRARAGYGRFALDDGAAPARRIERLVGWRCRRLGLPYGDQGLLVHRDLYRAAGGFPAIPLMEDVALVRRIGRRRLVPLPFAVTTSAERYRRGGYVLRPLRNLGCLALYLAGLPPSAVRRLYG
ncbi:glycosyltransferase [Skermanella sp. TT6]|uniref:glycosyltransferase n=1 Tax=Skermanella cutis TaxID=2775420 RepID=UPI0021110914|nr:glycosyltransferase [Skermanella sp. TT6]